MLTKKQLKQIAESKRIQRKWAAAEKKCQALQKLVDDAWRKKFPKFLEEFKRAPKIDKGIWGDFLPEGIRDTEIHLVDSAGQKLDFRVGPVFGKTSIYPQPGLWVGVQSRYYCSPRNIELLISPAIWRRLNKEMEKRFKRFNPKGYGPF